MKTIIFIFAITIMIHEAAISLDKLSRYVQASGDSATLQPADSAVELAFDYSGFDKLPGFSRESSIRHITLDTILDPPLNFLDTLIFGRVTWRIEFNNLIFGSSAQDEILPKAFAVLIDAHNLQMLGIHSIIEVKDSAILKPNDLGDYSRVPSKPLFIKCHGLESTRPNNSLVDLISGDTESGTKLSCKRVSAYFLDCSYMKDDRHPTWCIICWGAPTPPAHRPVGRYPSASSPGTGTSLSFIDDTNVTKRVVKIE